MPLKLGRLVVGWPGHRDLGVADGDVLTQLRRTALLVRGSGASGRLRRKAVVSDAEISAATDAYLTDRKAGPFAFASGHSLDVAKAVEAHRPAKAIMAEKGVMDAYRLTMVRTAVILATPSTK